jgi:hypothetical protein
MLGKIQNSQNCVGKTSLKRERRLCLIQKPLPRWMVDRTFFWFGHNRHLVVMINASSDPRRIVQSEVDVQRESIPGSKHPDMMRLAIEYAQVG